MNAVWRNAGPAYEDCARRIKRTVWVKLGVLGDFAAISRNTVLIRSFVCKLQFKN